MPADSSWSRRKRGRDRTVPSRSTTIVERADRDPPKREPVGGQPHIEALDRGCLAGTRPAGQQDGDRLRAQPAQGEGQHAGRGRIEPLRVVHGEQQGPAFGEQAHGDSTATPTGRGSSAGFGGRSSSNAAPSARRCGSGKLLLTAG